MHRQNLADFIWSVADTPRGDAHALDQGRPVATLVLAVLRRQDSGDAQDAVQTGVPMRVIWARAGVLVNELARPALFLSVSLAIDAFAAGEPAYLSLRALLRTPPRWKVAERTVFVCENPNLLAIAIAIAAAAALSSEQNFRPLGPGRIEAAWDGGLAAAMSSCGRANDEEALAGVVLPDLASDSG